MNDPVDLRDKTADSEDKTSQSKPTGGKSPYKPPKLTEFGSVKDLTKNLSSGPNADGGRPGWKTDVFVD